MIQIQTDAAFRQATNEAAAGIVFIKDKVQKPLAGPLSPCQNNHEAEFKALLWGLQQINDQLDEKQVLEIQSDSKILVDALQKRYAKHFQELVDAILALIPNLELTFFVWVKDKDNKGPHQLAWQVLN
ncbi:ribonuclease HI family protein [Fructobacillus sp. M1-13]|uniref:Ribonuclease HI family protein n=1 Tax=Fructobacillus papyriferae TaxID=2713171 RepID=A0ABS5QP06_9LACO|nr:ribonuclease HI family protein [Fructobacillus papyriferae]MBS9334800.1 ribonuclease HI family protein [Fructobacillus papyriferae]MCD2158790.1 ribonuclease HI family protein [Fructobacillus papyriferae]